MAITLQNLLDDLRIELNDPEGITFQDDQCIYNLNKAYNLTYRQIGNDTKQKYFVATSSQDTVAAQSNYAIADFLDSDDDPINYLRIVSVSIFYNDRLTPMKRYSGGIASRPVDSTAGLGLWGPVPTYDFDSDEIILNPPIQQAITDGLQVSYVASPTQLALVADTLHADFKQEWRDVVVLRAAKACYSQVEAMGAIVAPLTFNERLKEAETAMVESVALRSLSPEKKRRKSFFQ